MDANIGAMKDLNRRFIRGEHISDREITSLIAMYSSMKFTALALDVGFESFQTVVSDRLDVLVSMKKTRELL